MVQTSATGSSAPRRIPVSSEAGHVKGRGAELGDQGGDAAIRVVGEHADRGAVILHLAGHEPVVGKAHGRAQKLGPAGVQRLDASDGVGHDRFP